MLMNKKQLLALQSLNVMQNLEIEQVFLKLRRLFDKNKINQIEVDFSHWGINKNQKYKFYIYLQSKRKEV